MIKFTPELTRRGFVGGATAAVAVTGMFGGPVAKAVAGSMPKRAMTRYKPVSLTAYHCSLVHAAMSAKLARTVADPAISAKDTAKALKSTRCPCCDTQITANLAAVQGRKPGKMYA